MSKQHKQQKKALKSGFRRNKSARYGLAASPLWQLHSIHRLCDLLRISVDEFKAVAADPSYRFFVDQSNPDKPRNIQEPLDQTMVIHYRLAKLLDSIDRPSFLHSATRRRSHLTNADVHRGDHTIASTDIHAFYENTTYAHVKAFLHKDLCWPHDIARLLARCLTVEGHLPTGSAVSPILSYFTHRKLFDNVSTLCTRAGARMTLYIDDVTLSGKNVTPELLHAIKKELLRQGLRTHKDSMVPAGRPAIVTGVVLRSNQMLLRNKQHRKICTLIDEIAAGNVSLTVKLNGHLAVAKSINPEAAGRLREKYRLATSSEQT